MLEEINEWIFFVVFFFMLGCVLNLRVKNVIKINWGNERVIK